jgi:Flp pilus assembly protein TadD
LAPADLEAELAVSESHFRMSDGVRARARLDAARRRFPKDLLLRERLIALSILLGDRALARSLLAAWLREEPGSPRALWLQGRVEADEMRNDAAVRLYEQALQKQPASPELQGALGEALRKLPGDQAVARAVAALARAVAAQPEAPNWRQGLAQALRRAGRLAEARRQALRALDLDPHRAELYSLIVQLARQERAAPPVSLFAALTRAVEERLREESRLWKATWRSPDDPRAYEALAGFLIRNGDLAAAESQLTEAVRLRPGDASLRARLARLRRLREVQ